MRDDMGFLTQINERIRRDLVAQPLDASALMARALHRPPPSDLAAALRAAATPLAPAVIAEVKRASPSAGDIAAQGDASASAAAYESGGAAAISVLTEPHHFNGSLVDLEAVRLTVEIPVLRKDFLVDPDQVIEARACGADAVLLIAASLSDAELRAMLSAVADLGMTALVETHSEGDLDRVLATDAAVVGVNARDLETLEVDVGTALRRLARVPRDRIAVMESGLSTRADVRAAADAGASAILVGEALMRSVDPAAKVRELRGEE
jgi:indole-3-glycerol phosphate synthase